MTDTQLIPLGYEGELSGYKACLFDSSSGEPVAWGFEILCHVSEERFNALKQHGTLECSYPTWFVIVNRINRAEAIAKYGEVTAEEFGPRGGWKSVTFGTTKFLSRCLRS